VVGVSIFAWEVGFESPWGLFFNLILARRGMYMGMVMGFVGREEWDRKQGMVTEHENGLCGERGIGKVWEWTVRGGGIGKAEQGMGMTKHEMAAYPLLP
jgi:hypothetical protein